MTNIVFFALGEKQAKGAASRTKRLAITSTLKCRYATLIAIQAKLWSNKRCLLNDLTMKVTASVLQLIACANVALAFSPSLQQRCSLTSRSPTCVFSSQWEDEDEEIATTTSFEDAGDSLRQEEDKDRMDGMGDFDANPAVS